MLNDAQRLVNSRGGFYTLVAQRQVPGSRSSRATCHRRPALLSARARLGAECAVLYRVRASCRPAPASVVTGTVIWARGCSNLVEVLLLHLPRRSSLYYRSEVECTTPFHHVLLPLVGAHRVAAADLPHTFSDGRKLLARKTCQLARDVQEYAPV